MTTLIPFILLLMLAASLFVLVPVLRFKSQASNEQNSVREQQNIALFQQSLEELENSLANQLIEASEYEKLKLELERNFLNDMESREVGRKNSTAAYARLIPSALMLVILAGGFFLYRNIGSAPELVLPELIEQLNASESVNEQVSTLSEIAAILDQRFQRRSDDLQTGYTLGTLYISLEEFSDAVRVFSRLSEDMEAGPDKATILGQLAQSQYLLAGSTLTPTVQTTIDEALLLNSNEQAIMSILAVEALLADDLDGAVNYWRRQISQLPVGSEQVAQLNERIATIEAYLAEQNGTEVVNSSIELTVSVSIDESIRNQIEPGMNVYVFARSEGTPPLAALVLQPEDLPTTVTLNESMAMLPQFTLASVETAYVGASISRQAVAGSGDFQVVSESFVISEQEETITLSIKDRLP
jgi:cytochrome c-type biogenesis protein CcmH